MGRVDRIKKLMKEIDFSHNLKIIDLSLEKSQKKIERFGKIFFKQRKEQGLTLSQATKLMRARDYFASMMVKLGEVVETGHEELLSHDALHHQQVHCDEHLKDEER